MNTEHKLSEIRQIAITVSDVATALPFYRDVLGLTFLFSPRPLSLSWRLAACASC
jgi:catechol 2,3-dioxygenase-like lactoylglutathione lyase family enzyme